MSVIAAREALLRYFGYDGFRLHQEAIIQSVLSGKDVIAIMPTGGGKSVCYQLPALLLQGVAIVVSPLIALMKDQVDSLTANGIPAAFLNGTQDFREQEYVKEQARKGTIKLLYIAPERMFSGDGSIAPFLKEMCCSLFAVDEAHCISQWGHDFRPEYLRLAIWKQEFPQVPVIALTASADKVTRNDILARLRLQTPAVYISGFNRANIHYYVYPKENTREQLIACVTARQDDCGIIYALSRKSTEELAAMLCEAGFVAAHYHAGMDALSRNKIQEAFKRDEIKIIVATIAFGMGIDKPNVRYVVHYDIPKSMEGYYQETGRAGRDGLRSDAILFYAPGDIMKLVRFTELEGNPEQTAIMKKKLWHMKDYAEQDGCRRQFILHYFGESFPDACGSCDACLTNSERQDITIDAQKFLSAVSRTGERFGTGYIIDFLRGASGTRIYPNHKLLKTYGIGKDQSKAYWQQVVRQLLRLHLLVQAGDKYPLLKLNKQSWQVLQGAITVTLSIRQLQEKKTPHPRQEVHPALLSTLKALRRDLAAAENIPAYDILGDNVLLELATRLPQRFEELKGISGFSAFKQTRYGAAFLEPIQSFVKAQQKTTGIQAAQSSRKPPGTSHRATLTLLMEGNSLADIAAQRGLAQSTIETHLLSFISAGTLSVTAVVSTEKIRLIQEVVEKTGILHTTKPVKDLLGDAVSYTEIRMVQADLTRKERT